MEDGSVGSPAPNGLKQFRLPDPTAPFQRASLRRQEKTVAILFRRFHDVPARAFTTTRASRARHGRGCFDPETLTLEQATELFNAHATDGVITKAALVEAFLTNASEDADDTHQAPPENADDTAHHASPEVPRFHHPNLKTEWSRMACRDALEKIDIKDLSFLPAMGKPSPGIEEAFVCLYILLQPYDRKKRKRMDPEKLD